MDGSSANIKKINEVKEFLRTSRSELPPHEPELREEEEEEEQVSAKESDAELAQEGVTEGAHQPNPSESVLPSLPKRGWFYSSVFTGLTATMRTIAGTEM